MLKLSTFIDNEEVLVLPGNDLIEIFAAWPISLLTCLAARWHRTGRLGSSFCPYIDKLVIHLSHDLHVIVTDVVWADVHAQYFLPDTLSLETMLSGISNKS